MPLARLSALCRRVARLSHDEHVSEEKVVAVVHVRAWKSMPEKLPDTIRDVVGGPESTLLHAKGAGALKFTREVLSDLQSILPPDLLPTKEDTTSSLAHRLAQSTFLDDVRVRKGGMCGKRLVPLNGTSYSQARSVTWCSPVGVSERWVDEDGDEVHVLHHYINPTRPSVNDVRCRIWPQPVHNLAEYVYFLAFPHLGTLSRAYPPNHCELKVYYSLFNSKIGRHKDFFTVAQLAHYMEHNEYYKDKKTRGQTPGSDVLIWSMGSTMHLVLSFPEYSDIESIWSPQSYQVHPDLVFPLQHGTLFVFKSRDDFYFCHEAYFGVDASNEDCRFAFVFRWVSSEAVYHASAEKGWSFKEARS